MTWFETKRGSDLLLLEQKILDQLFDHLFGYNIVQIGNHRSLIENSRFKNKYTCKQIQFDAEQLPFESNAIDYGVIHLKMQGQHLKILRVKLKLVRELLIY